MRTTLNIDDDVLEAVRGVSAVQRRSIGAVISDLARRTLTSGEAGPVYRNGILLLPNREGVTVTMELVSQLDDETA